MYNTTDTQYLSIIPMKQQQTKIPITLDDSGITIAHSVKNYQYLQKTDSPGHRYISHNLDYD